jgi:hypothetical protein
LQVRKEVTAGYGLPAGEERGYIRIHIAEEERDYSRIQIAGEERSYSRIQIAGEETYRLDLARIKSLQQDTG